MILKTITCLFLKFFYCIFITILQFSRIWIRCSLAEDLSGAPFGAIWIRSDPITIFLSREISSEMRRHPSSPRRRGRRRSRLLLLFVVSTVLLILLSWISSATIDPSRDPALPSPDAGRDNHEDGGLELAVEERREGCATVEKMGEAFAVGSENESLRVRELIQHHFDLHGKALSLFFSFPIIEVVEMHVVLFISVHMVWILVVCLSISYEKHVTLINVMHDLPFFFPIRVWTSHGIER